MARLAELTLDDMHALIVQAAPAHGLGQVGGEQPCLLRSSFDLPPQVDWYGPFTVHQVFMGKDFFLHEPLDRG